MRIPWRKYTCCDGSPTCANNRTRRFIDHLWLLAFLNPKRFKEDLWNYIENVETDRDMLKFKCQKLMSPTPKEGL